MDEKKEEKKVQVQVPRRLVIIEPVLMNVMLFGFPFVQVSQLFLYSRIKAYTAHEKGINLTEFGSNHSDNQCDVNKSSAEYQFTQYVQQNNSYFNIIDNLCQTLPSFFILLFIGGYSDKRGRKYSLILPLVGGLLQTSGYLLTIALELPLWVIWIVDFIYGCSGGSKLLFVACFTYLSDITTKENRQFRMTLLELLSFVTGILGPIGIGYWIQTQGFAWPMAFSASGHVINLVYVIFFVPETIIYDPNEKVKLFTFSHFTHTANVFTVNTADNRKWKLWVLLVGLLIHTLVWGIYGIEGLFVLNVPLCWNAVIIGYYGTVSIAVGTIGGIISAKCLRFCMQEPLIALLSSGFGVMQNVYRGFIRNTVMMFMSTLFSGFAFLLTPTTRAMMSNLVDQDEQGSLFGAIGLVEVFTSLIGSEGMKLLYANTLYISTTFVFFIAAIIELMVFFSLLGYNIKLRGEHNSYEKLEDVITKDKYEDSVTEDDMSQNAI